MIERRGELGRFASRGKRWTWPLGRAAILPGVGRPVRYRVTSDAEDRRGVVEALEGRSYERIGWLHDYTDEMLEALHVVECLLRSPASLALFLQAGS